MLTIEIPVSVDLRDLSNLPGRVQSVYFRRPLGDESTAARRHAVVTRLAEQGVGASGLRAVDDALCDVRPGRGAVALFLGDDGEHRLLSMPGAQTADSADWSALPNLLPLLAWRQASPAYVLAVLDREGAELTVQPAFGGRPDTVRVSGPDDEVCGNVPSGRPQDRFQRRIEDSRQHNADRGAAAAAEALKTSGARLLLVAGDAHTVGLFTDRLPAWVAQEADVRRVGGGRSHDGAPGSRTDRVKAAVADAVAAQTRALLDEFAAHGGPDGLAVQGAAAVLHALAQGRVRTLLVTDSGADERVAWFGARPTEVSGHRGDLEQTGAHPRHGRLVDAAVRAALLTDAEVRVLEPGTAGAPAQGLGALCRFR